MKAAWQSAYKHEDAEITSLANLIQKDVRRTDRSVKFFDDKENASCEKLFQILMTYSVYHPEPGYVQGNLLYIKENLCTNIVFIRYERYGSAYFICNTR